MAGKTNLIGYCGLYCPDCPSYTQEVADLARDLRKVLRHHKFNKFAPMLAKMPAFKAFKNYENGYELLGAMMKMRCKGRSCRQGGWGSGCLIKKCAKEKGFTGCWQCSDFEDCKTLKVLEQYGDTLHLKNLRKIKRTGPAAFARQKAVTRS